MDYKTAVAKVMEALAVGHRTACRIVNRADFPKTWRGETFTVSEEGFRRWMEWNTVTVNGRAVMKEALRQ